MTVFNMLRGCKGIVIWKIFSYCVVFEGNKVSLFFIGGAKGRSQSQPEYPVCLCGFIPIAFGNDLFLTAFEKFLQLFFWRPQLVAMSSMQNKLE